MPPGAGVAQPLRQRREQLGAAQHPGVRLGARRDRGTHHRACFLARPRRHHQPHTRLADSCSPSASVISMGSTLPSASSALARSG